MTTNHSSHGNHAAHGTHHSAEPAASGVTSALGGYLLSPIAAPGAVGDAATLSFQILDAHGDAVTSFAASHGERLHLIVVRADGTQFRHVHPTLDAAGTWSVPWEWEAAGTYRVYADAVPTDGNGATPLTLTRTVDVAGPFAPKPPTPSAAASVGGFDVTLAGDLVAGSSAELIASVSRAGKPVTTLQPYLGAFGHLVALREGDLAYLHVHPEGDEPSAGDLSGPEVRFAAEAPTPGRYLLYLDFQVDGQVLTAPFALDAAPAGQRRHG